ncbi:hypothetical protein Ple7327_2400 [Pleurocapsa sp. PCC 7327]|uniref:DUF6335 family protein n=1 Tax=Pleurocapsa sp. PCC 7327 TaxID=118163 RepID=UPI00029FE8DE|nr:DUF6335 family protein [Pleurocapsa sp. PCC 7327]AFY77701.1 hypothetical protein Ple7327_2400 [Pleurocapsa sp. PCC 7327]
MKFPFESLRVFIGKNWLPHRVNNIELKAQLMLHDRGTGGIAMKDSNFFQPINSPKAAPEIISQEMLLADLIGTEEAELIFEGLVDRDLGMGRTLETFIYECHSSTNVTGGDLDDDWYQAEVVGEEAVGGQTPTPDQSVTEQLLQSMGIASVDGEPIRTRDKLERRDRIRWELEPESSEDYWDRFE